MTVSTLNVLFTTDADVRRGCCWSPAAGDGWVPIDARAAWAAALDAHPNPKSKLQDVTLIEGW